jgi:hypothetical protein
VSVKEQISYVRESCPGKCQGTSIALARHSDERPDENVTNDSIHTVRSADQKTGLAQRQSLTTNLGQLNVYAKEFLTSAVWPIGQQFNIE